MWKQDHLNQFAEQGWVVIDLSNPRPLLDAIDSFKKYFFQISQKKCPLEDYHLIAENDEEHTQMQIEMTSFYREKKFAREILKTEEGFFKELVGSDLLIQANPYLRMVRPGKKQDNVGYHRDTFYGGSPYEVSVILPFVDCDAKMSLSVLPKSHVLSEKLFPVTQEGSNVVKGSEKHKLGFLYAPKVMSPEIHHSMQPVPLKVGQILIFSLSTVHGSVENKGMKTRWTSDVRVVNELAPVNFTERPNYYEPYHSTPVTSSAKQYLEANLEV